MQYVPLSFEYVSGAIAESKPEKEHEQQHTVPAFGTKEGYPESCKSPNTATQVTPFDVWNRTVKDVA